eukprot:scaffold13562_cov44-Attheya_sp.AAC.4
MVTKVQLRWRRSVDTFFNVSIDPGTKVVERDPLKVGHFFVQGEHVVEFLVGAQEADPPKVGQLSIDPISIRGTIVPFIINGMWQQSCRFQQWRLFVFAAIAIVICQSQFFGHCSFGRGAGRFISQ